MRDILQALTSDELGENFPEIQRVMAILMPSANRKPLWNGQPLGHRFEPFAVRLPRLPESPAAGRLIVAVKGDVPEVGGVRVELLPHVVDGGP